MLENSDEAPLIAGNPHGYPTNTSCITKVALPHWPESSYNTGISPFVVGLSLYPVGRRVATATHNAHRGRNTIFIYLYSLNLIILITNIMC
jgi:hypothetical protein